MDYCVICHDYPCELLNDEQHQGAVALSEVIEKDREYHIYPGFGISADCTKDMVDALRERGFEIKRIADVH